MKYLLVIVSSLILAARESHASEHHEARRLLPEDWQPAHYTLYSRNYPHLSYNETLDLIKKLHDIYEPFSDQETNWRKTRINRLLETSRHDISHCSWEYLNDMRELRDYNRPYRMNVYPFVDMNLIAMQHLCEQNVNQIVNDRVEALGQTMRDDMDSLVHDIITSHGISKESIRELVTNIDRVSRGVVEFMAQKMTAEKLVRESKEELSADLENYVLDMCYKWNHAVGYGKFMARTSKIVHLNDQVVIWTRYKDLCDLIIGFKQPILKRLHRRLVPRNALVARLQKLNPLAKKTPKARAESDG